MNYGDHDGRSVTSGNTVIDFGQAGMRFGKKKHEVVETGKKKITNEDFENLCFDHVLRVAEN